MRKAEDSQRKYRIGIRKTKDSALNCKNSALKYKCMPLE